MRSAAILRRPLQPPSCRRSVVCSPLSHSTRQKEQTVSRRLGLKQQEEEEEQGERQAADDARFAGSRKGARKRRAQSAEVGSPSGIQPTVSATPTLDLLLERQQAARGVLLEPLCAQQHSTDPRPEPGRELGEGAEAKGHRICPAQHGLHGLGRRE